MKIFSIDNNIYTPSFCRVKKEKKREENRNSFVESVNSGIPKSFTRTQVVGSVLFAVMVGAGLRQGKIKAERSKNAKLSEELSVVKNQLANLIDNSITPREIQDKTIERLSKKLSETKLDYDIKNPPVTGIEKPKVYPDAVELPKSVKTNNRSYIRKIDIPEISSSGEFDFALPKTREIKIEPIQRKHFTSVVDGKTNVTESYADSVVWDNDKIARDILQNFFDGHGQTLDGVKFKFQLTTEGKVRVRISGESTYTPDKAIYLGESTKRDNTFAAGNYGEGLKMATLKLLKNAGVHDVKFASDNWQLNYKFLNDSLLGKRVLAYDLSEVSPINGNYIEFETSDKSLLKSIRKCINYFYHSGNEHFKCPDFENDLLGIKLLPPEDNTGAIYIAGQRFDYNNNPNGFRSAVLFLKQKPDVKTLNLSRDRISLNDYNIEAIANWFTRRDFQFGGKYVAPKQYFPNEDAVKFLKAMDRYWDFNPKNAGPMDKFSDAVLSRIAPYGKSKDNLHIKFPENYVAYSPASDEVVKDLRSKGIRVCKSDFSYFGMPTIRQFVGDARAHKIVQPSESQKKKIMILREAVNTFKKSLEGGYFTKEELNPKIFLFNNRSEKEKGLYNNVLAEAIIDNEESKGFWIDCRYLDNSNFSDVLETCLHELSHKAGGDESSEFSYKLTAVNKAVLSQIVEDVQSRADIQALNKLWDDVSK